MIWPPQDDYSAHGGKVIISFFLQDQQEGFLQDQQEGSRKDQQEGRRGVF